MRSPIAKQVVLLFYWILSTGIAGAVLGIVAPLASAGAFEAIVSNLSSAIILVGAPLSGALVGAISGFLQYLTLRRLARSTWWVLSSTLGWAAGLMLAASLFFWLIPEGANLFTLIVPAAFGGALAGLIQRRTLKNWVGNTGWYVLAMASGWAFGAVVSLSFGVYLQASLADQPHLLLLGLGGLFGAMVGFQTGFVIVVLLSYSAIPAVPAAGVPEEGQAIHLPDVIFEEDGENT